MNREGLSGAAIQMFNHGLITAALFLLLAAIEQRRGRVTLTDESRGLAAATQDWECYGSSLPCRLRLARFE